MTPVPRNRSRAVQLWLLAVAALVFCTLIVGGATRLTESGLSIVEWKPVTGVLPPVSETSWQAEFAKYQTIPQYQTVNRGMSLAEFKVIYWWEWSHRFLARLVGLAFLIPFILFLWGGAIAPSLRNRLWAIFAAGAVLGGVGWWMVSSGLAERTSVSQYRLAFHLTLACAIYAAIVWTSQQVLPRRPVPSPAPVRNIAFLLAVLILAQIYLGAIVAGLRAGLSYNTWPLMDGVFIPSADNLWRVAPAWRNPFENILAVQFNHRMLAYGVWILALIHMAITVRSASDSRTKREAVAITALVTLQAALGIMTLLYISPLALALAHQALAVVVLTVVIIHAERLRHRVDRREWQTRAPAGGVVQ